MADDQELDALLELADEACGELDIAPPATETGGDTAAPGGGGDVEAEADEADDDDLLSLAEVVCTAGRDET